ncbi:MAG TPA: hypothetical protein VH816_11830 [Gaiellaceae bacterium]|jgi:hypothetical protein
MTRRRAFRIVAAALAVSAAAAVTILLNLTLLGYAQPRNDPVGRLSPRLTELPVPAVPVAPPARPHEHSEEPDD